MQSPVAQLMDQLAAIHEAAWDAGAGLVKVLPGMDPGADAGEPARHIVRESALGAYFDLCNGRTARAHAAIDAVLRHQYDAPGTPWHGTFRVIAQHPDPPLRDAAEWVDYDPNWRQFLGVILALCVSDFGHLLGTDRTVAITNAVRLAIDGEPAGRIPDWYTNPSMLHAWLEGWYGARAGDDALVSAALRRLGVLHGRLTAFGDVDEYNSPTYDGIDLFAAALWATLPPAAEFGKFGQAFIRTIGARLSSLYQPELGVPCGPYIRAYGLDIGSYVSLAGIWLALAGEPAGRVLPYPLNGKTDHIHDLYFLPVFARLSGAVTPNFDFTKPFPRRYQQRFHEIVSESSLTRTVAIGAERGRVPDFAKDQYVPVTAHTKDADGVSHWLGFKLGSATATIDAAITSPAEIRGRAAAAGGCPEADLVIVSSAEPILTGGELAMGPIRVALSPAPASAASTEQSYGLATRLTFPQQVVEFTVTAGI